MLLCSAVLEGGPGWWTSQLVAVPANGHSSGWMLWIREARASYSSCWQSPARYYSGSPSYLQLLLLKALALSCSFSSCTIVRDAAAAQFRWFQFQLLNTPASYSFGLFSVEGDFRSSSLKLQLLCSRSGFLQLHLTDVGLSGFPAHSISTLLKLYL